jgi:hypothetical protein
MALAKGETDASFFWGHVKKGSPLRIPAIAGTGYNMAVFAGQDETNTLLAAGYKRGVTIEDGINNVRQLNLHSLLPTLSYWESDNGEFAAGEQQHLTKLEPFYSSQGYKVIKPTKDNLAVHIEFLRNADRWNSPVPAG